MGSASPDEYFQENINIIDQSEALSIQEKIKKFQDVWENESTDHSSSLNIEITNIPKIRENELHITRLIGRGAFAEVHEAYVMENPTEKYAIKRLRTSVLDESNNSFETSISDLAFETAILSSLKHENIVSLHKIKEGNTMDLLLDGDCMLALELLDETLFVRLKRWHKQWSRQKLLRSSVNSNVVITRLENVALGIVSAMEYLHSNKIIYRDLKPSNIGFDRNNTVKLFDFGFARLCDKEDDDRLMTGAVGTPRYMAPEVANYDKYYSFPADVYSFSILLWQIVTSQIPFKNIKSETRLAKEVTLGNRRPSLLFIRSDSLRQLIESGWSMNAANRPTFGEIQKELKRIIVEHHLSKRSLSYFSFDSSRNESKNREEKRDYNTSLSLTD